MKYLFITLIVIISHMAYAYDINCVEAASTKYNVPAEVIQAIIAVESGGNPLAVNILGKAFAPRTYDDALILLAYNKGKSTDVGLMQVNSQWFKKFGIPQESGFDECFNVEFGTWILANEIARHGFNWKAIAKYHSPSSREGNRYALKVIRQLVAILR